MSVISISTCFDYSIPIEVQLQMIKDAGYKYVSIGGNYEHSGILDDNRLKELKKQILVNNLSVDTIHGYVMDKPDTLDVNRKVVKAAAELQAPVVVLHCSPFTFNPATLESRRNDINQKLQLFEELAQISDIKFALENVLPGIATDFMEETLNKSNPEYFGFCYDSSHDQIDGPRPFSLLERLSHRLLTVHISDRIMEFVDHVTPGEGFIDFDNLCYLLEKANIKFPLLMEVMTANSKYKDPKEFLTITHNEALKLYKKIYVNKFNAHNFKKK